MTEKNWEDGPDEDMPCFGRFSEMMDPMDCDEDAHLPEVDGADDGSQDRDVGKSARDEVRNIIFTWNLRKEK